MAGVLPPLVLRGSGGDDMADALSLLAVRGGDGDGADKAPFLSLA